MTQPNFNRFAVIYCTDDKTLPYTLYSAKSAIENTADRNFDVIVASLDPLEIPGQLAGLDFSMVHLDMRSELEAHHLPLKHLPITTYLRLWLCRLYQDRYDRILYLDVDTWVSGQHLSDIFHIDMGTHPVAGTRDVMQWTNIEDPIYDFADRGIQGKAYLNAGVMMFDVARYNKARCLERMLDFLKTDQNLVLHDQSLLNIVLLNERAELSYVWNWQWTRNVPFLTNPGNPQIMHFCSASKPWNADAINDFSRDMVAAYADFLGTHFPERSPQFSQIPNQHPLINMTKKFFRLRPAFLRNQSRFPSRMDVYL